MIFIKGFLKNIYLISLFLFLFCFQSNAYAKDLVNKDMHPLIDARGIAVDSKGQIYWGIHMFSSIHVYDQNGIFRYSIDIKGAGGDFRLKLDEDDNLWVATARNNMMYKFDSNSKLIKEFADDKAFFNMGDRTEFSNFDRLGNKYEIRNPMLLFPHIVVLKPSGSQKVLITDSWFNLIFLRYIPIILLMGIVLAIRYEQKRSKK